MKNLFSYFGKQICGDFVYLSKTKTDEARQIPLNNDLEELLKDIRKRNQLKSEHLFRDKHSKPLRDIKISFHAACRKAGIEDSRFHDLLGIPLRAIS